MLRFITSDDDAEAKNDVVSDMDLPAGVLANGGPFRVRVIRGPRMGEVKDVTATQYFLIKARETTPGNSPDL